MLDLVKSKHWMAFISSIIHDHKIKISPNVEDEMERLRKKLFASITNKFI